jgi:hypothetical protein
MKFEKLGQQPQQQQQLQEQDPVADQEAQRLYQEYLAAKSAYENYIKGNKPQLKDAGYKGKGMVTGSAYWSDERLKNIIGALRR